MEQVSLFRFLSSFNDGFEKNYQQFIKVPSSRSKKVGDMRSFYSNVVEIDDSPEAYCFTVRTVNILDISITNLVSFMIKREI